MPVVDSQKHRNVSDTGALPQAIETSEIGESLEYTCSIFSTRMPTNETCDDLPGPGRLLDTYFYQPAGRLVERAINRFIIQANTRWIHQEISEAYDIIVSFHDSIRLQFHGEWSVRHRYWQGERIVTEMVPISVLLYFWGAQNSGQTEDDAVVKQCRRIASFASSPHLTAQKAGLKHIVRLLDRYPRLRVYFDLSVMCDRVLATKHHQLFEDVFWVLIDYRRERSGIDNLLLKLSQNLPEAEVSEDNLALFRGPMLDFFAESFSSFKTSRTEGGIFRYEFNHFLEQLLRVESLFRLHDFQYHEDGSIGRFWTRLADLWGDEQLNPRLLTKRMAALLRLGMIRTWESLGPVGTQTPQIGDFNKTSLSLFARLDSWTTRSKTGTLVAGKTELEVLMEQKLLA